MGGKIGRFLLGLVPPPSCIPHVPFLWLSFAKQADSDFAVGGWSAIVLAAKEIFKAQRKDMEKSTNGGDLNFPW